MAILPSNFRKWSEDEINSIAEVIRTSVRYVGDLIDRCDREGMHMCCHILTAVAALLGGFASYNRTLKDDMTESIKVLCQELYLKMLEAGY